MASGTEDFEAKLGTIQDKLDSMHKDIKRIVASNGGGGLLLSPLRTNGSRYANGAHTHSQSDGRCASPNANAHATASPARNTAPGRACRFIAPVESCSDASTTHGPNTANESVSPFLPAIARSPVKGELVDVSIMGANSLSVRRKLNAAKQKREEFTYSLRQGAGDEKAKDLRGAPCSWMLSIALACSYVSGEQITIEDVLRYNRLGVHYVSFPSVTLAELFDITSEFLQNHTKLAKMDVHCEVATFDTETVDDVIEVGERLPIMTLSQFRKEMTVNNTDTHSIYIVNYDPYVVEQYEISRRMNSSEAFDTDTRTPVPRWSPKNQGTFALILNFDSARHFISIGTPHLLENGRVDIQEQTVPIQTLHKALCVKDLYCNRSRGFVRVFIDSGFIADVPSIFPLKVLDGSMNGGFNTTAFDTSISPHILGLALLHHLVTSTLLDSSAQRRGTNDSVCDTILRGIPVTKIAQVLRLDVATIVGGSNKSSVPTAYSWYRVFLRRLGIENAVAFGLVLPARRGGAEDGPLNVSEDAFMSHIGLAVESKSVMLVGFDVNVAHNVNVDKRLEPCHFAIVIGFDRERRIVRMADVNVKKYKKTWHIPLARLYAAVIGYGYMMVATSQAIIDKLKGREFELMVLREARYNLPPMRQQLRFEYPVKNYVVTILADAFSRLGFSDANIESVVNTSGFHLSFMLSEHIPLENAATVVRNYSHNCHSDAVSVKTQHLDKGCGYTSLLLLKQIRAALESPKTQCLVVNFQTSIIQAAKEVWNGSNGGSYAIVVDYDENSSLVTLSDANHVAFYRTWVCPLETLYSAASAMDPIALRARGTLLLTLSSQEELYANSYGYDMSRLLVHHPFKPSFSPAFHCFALVASHLCADDGPKLAEQFSAEDFLYATPSFSVHSFLMTECSGADLAQIANAAFRVLKLPLEAAAVPIATEAPGEKEKERERERAGEKEKERAGEKERERAGEKERERERERAAGRFADACRDGEATLVGYGTRPVHGAGGFSVGVVNRIRRGAAGASLQIVDGNGCAFGAVWERPAAELLAATTALVRVRKVVKKEKCPSVSD